ncbi:MAG: phosphate/phosphite/phosphonate ABC transporter substrate-binding protein [Chloroflexi bacterium]|nr:phosphate/phosphite/phosphonate ABC transporter substrate-binding protein [Chloroflexota bacterium]
MACLPAMFVVFAVAAIGLSSCSPNVAYKTVNLADVEAAFPAETPSGLLLRVAIAPVISPKSTVAGYSDFVQYLGRKMGRPAELVQRATYGEVNELIRRGSVDVALICSGAYVEGKREFGMELLAAPQVNGAAVYYSYTIVLKDSPVQAVAQLRGKVFAFTDPLSNTGYFAPVYLLSAMGERPDSFFQRTILTYSHENSIKAVVDGLVDGAAVDSLVFDYAVARQPNLSERLRIVDKSSPFGIPPVVTAADAPPELKAKLKSILLEMHQDEEGRRILEDLMFDKFVPIDDSAYDSVRRNAAASRK